MLKKSNKTSKLIQINPVIASLPQQPITGPIPSSLPKKLIIREVDLSIINDVISIDYNKTNSIIQNPNIPSILKELADGTFKFDDHYGKVKPKMSLNVKEKCYVIFKLSNRNWQFSSEERDPITLGSDVDSKDIICYSDLNLVDSQGNVVKKPYNKTECRIAYFIVDGERLVKNHPKAGKYKNSFNLNVEIYDPQNPSMVMPILIDPDIRNPGGSGS